jgi:feruloyl-CoA synthase
MTELVIDRLAQDAERAPEALLRPACALTNGQAWAQSGAVASWLIAQGFGPRGRSLAVSAPDGVERAILLLGALRAGALVVEAAEPATLAFAARAGRLVSSEGVALAALARCSVDAAVAERRLHIRPDTPARIIGGTCRHHADFMTIADALSG